MPQSLKLVYSAVKGEFADAIAKIQRPIAKAAMGAMKDTQNFVKQTGRAKIAAAGFSVKWQNALRVDIFPMRGTSLNPAVFVHHNIIYAGVFEEGATIGGKPLLWLPLPGTPARIGNGRFTPANYRRTIGQLVPVNRPGKPPLLLGFIQGGKRSVGKITARKLKAGQVTKQQLIPLFVGISRVNIRGRFGLAGVFQTARNNLGSAYFSHLRPEDRS